MMSCYKVTDPKKIEPCSELVEIKNSESNFLSCGPNSNISKKKWTIEEDNKLIELAELAKGKKWKWVAKQFPGKKDTQCRSRWERIRPGMKQGRWSVDEDEILLRQYQIHGYKWSEIAKHLEHRTGKQVRDRIKNVYDSNINKDEFTPEEDELVYMVFVQLGPRWKQIRDTYFPDRTSDYIKNRFYSHYKKLEEKFRNRHEEIKFQDLSDFKLNFFLKKRERTDSIGSSPSISSNAKFKSETQENFISNGLHHQEKLNFYINSSEDEKEEENERKLSDSNSTKGSQIISKVSNSSDKIILEPSKFMYKLKTRKNLRKKKNSDKEEKLKHNKINKCTEHSENETESCKLEIYENKNNISLKNSENIENTHLRKETDSSNFECINCASCLSTNNFIYDSQCNIKENINNLNKQPNICTATRDKIFNKFKTFEKIKSLFALLSNTNNLLNLSFDQMLKNLNILMIIINYYEKSKCN